MPKGNRHPNMKGLKPWPKGVSGNPKGGPKKLPLLKDLMAALLGTNKEDLTQAPIAKIVDALIDETRNKKRGNQRVAAAKEIIERAFGKAKPIEEDVKKQDIVWNETKTYGGKAKEETSRAAKKPKAKKRK